MRCELFKRYTGYLSSKRGQPWHGTRGVAERNSVDVILNLKEKMAFRTRRLFEEKEKEAKRLEKKLRLKVQRTCIARTVWEMV